MRVCVGTHSPSRLLYTMHSKGGELDTFSVSSEMPAQDYSMLDSKVKKLRVGCCVGYGASNGAHTRQTWMDEYRF